MIENLIILVQKYFKKKEFQKILELSKKNKDLFNENETLLESLCLSYFYLSNYEKSEEYCKKILNKNENHIGANFFLAKINRSKDLDLALNYYKKAIKLSGFSKVYVEEFVFFASSLGLYDDAINYSEELIKKNQNDINLKINLSQLHDKNGAHQKSIEILNEILNSNLLQDQEDKIYNLIATSYFNAEDFKSAEENFLKSYSLNPQNTEAILNHAILLQTLGDFEKSEEIINLAINQKPSAEAYRLITLGKKFKSKDDHYVHDMLTFSSNDKLNDNEKISINFALGKVFEDIKDYKKSSSYYLAGNKLKRSLFKGYDFKLEKDIFKKLRQAFSKEFFSKFSNKKPEKQNLIFIIGMPRSGTTLLEQMLSSHKDIYGAGELNIITESVDKVLKAFSFENYIRELKFINGEKISELFNHIKLKFGEIYKQTSKKYIIDKNPLNYRNIGIIKLALPSAKIIHIQRDQNDNCLSIFKNYFHLDVMPWSYSTNEVREYYSEYKNFMSDFKNKLGNYIYDTSYENLTANTSDELKKILNFLELDWDPNCEKFYENKRAVKTASISQVRQGVYQTSKKKWIEFKNYLPDLFV